MPLNSIVTVPLLRRDLSTKEIENAERQQTFFKSYASESLNDELYAIYAERVSNDLDYILYIPENNKNKKVLSQDQNEGICNE